MIRWFKSFFYKEDEKEKKHETGSIFVEAFQQNEELKNTDLYGVKGNIGLPGVVGNKVGLLGVKGNIGLPGVVKNQVGPTGVKGNTTWPNILAYTNDLSRAHVRVQNKNHKDKIEYNKKLILMKESSQIIKYNKSSAISDNVFDFECKVPEFDIDTDIVII
jgi:hypothetical protein